MRFPTLLLPLAITTLLLAPLARAVALDQAGNLAEEGASLASTETYDGAGFQITVPENFDVTERSNGQIYFLELRRRDTDEDEFAPLQLMLIPGAAAQLDGPTLVGMLKGEIEAYAAKSSLSVQSTKEVTRRIAGEDRLGQQLILKQAFAIGEYEAYGFAFGGDLIGVLAKISYGEEERLQAAVDSVLPSVIIKPLTAESLRTVALEGLQFQVPAMLNESRTTVSGNQILRLGFPEGVLELVVKKMVFSDEARNFAAQFPSQRSAEVRTAIQAAGGQYLRQRWTGIWTHGGILAGTRLDLVDQNGQNFHSYSYCRALWNLALVANFECTAENRDAMTQHFTQTMATLRSTLREVQIEMEFRGSGLCQDLGLSFFFPKGMRVTKEVAEVPRLILQNDFLTPNDPFRVLFEAHPAPFAVGELESRLQAIALQFYPGATMAETWKIAGLVFGKQQEGAALRFRYQNEEYQINALPGPHRHGELLTAVLCPAADAAPSLWIFANLHSGLTQIPDGRRRINSADVEMVFDPAAWALVSKPTSIGNEFQFASRSHTGQIRLEVERWRDCKPTDNFSDLLRRARNAFQVRRASSGIELDSGAAQIEELVHSEFITVTEIGGVTALRSTILAGLPGEAEWELTTWYLRLLDAVVQVRSRALVKDAAAREEIQQLVASLVVQHPQVFRSEHVGMPLEVEVPVGYTANSTFSQGEQTIAVTDALSQGEQTIAVTDALSANIKMTVAVVDAAGMSDLPSLRKSTAAAMKEAARRNYGGDVIETTMEAEFLGEVLPMTRYTLQNADGVAAAIQAKLFLIQGNLGYEITLMLAPGEAEEGAVTKLLAILATAKNLPVWRHVEENHYAFAYPPELYQLHRAAREAAPCWISNL